MRSADQEREALPVTSDEKRALIAGRLKELQAEAAAKHQLTVETMIERKRPANYAFQVDASHEKLAH
jgi:hypothetical protein